MNRIEEVKKILSQSFGEVRDFDSGQTVGGWNYSLTEEAKDKFARQICQLTPDYSALKRFWEMVTISDNGCWEWLGKTQNLGYGQFHLGRKLVLAHRFAYEAFVGEIPGNLETDHLCRNRKCVNPAHLETVTHSENNRRGDCGLHTALKNWAKTHCAKGHPYNEGNTYYWRGWRKCRICSRESNKRWREKNAKAK